MLNEHCYYEIWSSPVEYGCFGAAAAERTIFLAESMKYGWLWLCSTIGRAVQYGEYMQTLGGRYCSSTRVGG